MAVLPPLTAPNLWWHRSFRRLGEWGNGTYTAEGIVAISDMLKVNTTLQSIRCVARVRFPIGVSSL